MNKKELEHYLKGGKFTCIYNPKMMDIDTNSKSFIGKTITVWQNIVVNPIIEYKEFVGQHAFNTDEIHGWFPEEDIKDLTIIDEFIDNPELLPKYMYRLYYSTKEQLEGNFGTGYDIELPYVSGREYDYDEDEYVKNLSNPAADKIEKAIWNGEAYEDIKWEELK